MIDETGIGGGDQRLYFYNVTNVVPCIDFERSETEGKKVVRPAFNADAVPTVMQVFKDPLRKKMDICLAQGTRDELARLMDANGLRGSTIAPTS